MKFFLIEHIRSYDLDKQSPCFSFDLDLWCWIWRWGDEKVKATLLGMMHVLPWADEELWTTRENIHNCMDVRTWFTYGRRPYDNMSVFPWAFNCLVKHLNCNLVWEGLVSESCLQNWSALHSSTLHTPHHQGVNQGESWHARVFQNNLSSYFHIGRKQKAKQTSYLHHFVSLFFK